MKLEEIKDYLDLLEDNEIKKVIIDNVFYTNNPKENVSIFIKKGDNMDYIKNIIEKRKKIPPFVERTIKEEKTKAELKNTLEKIKTASDLLKKIKSTLIKYSVDDDFNYRMVSDIIKNKPFYNNIDHIDCNNLNDELLTNIIFNQVVYSLEEYTIIHPKIKLIISELNKEPFNLSFSISE